MENNNLSIDLSMFAASLIAIRENTTYIEFDNMMSCVSKANDRGKLEEFLNQAQAIYSQGSDLTSAIANPLSDHFVDQGQDF